MKTTAVKASDIRRAWWVVDAEGMVLGRLAAEVARLLVGKHKPAFAPYLDTGDCVVVVNAGKARLTGDKLQSKIWYRHSGYPGGLRAIPYSRLMETRPEVAVEKAIKGMLPRNRLGRAMGRKLHVYAGPNHPHAAQQPKAWVPVPRGESSDRHPDDRSMPMSATEPAGT
ncbi:MAG: 50S ribosomal protein L13 [Actinomycetota bacterium]